MSADAIGDPGESEPVDSFFRTTRAPADLKQRAIRGGVLTMAAQVVRFLMGLLSTVVLARLLRPDDFGLVAMATAITAFLLLFRELGLSTATIQRAEINQQQISALFWVNFGIGLGLMVVTFLIARPVASFYGEPRLVNVVRVLAIGLPLGGAAVQHQALLRRQMQFGRLARIDISSATVSVLTAIAIAWGGGGYWALVSMPVVTQLILAVGSWLSCPWKPGLPRRTAGVASMLGFGGNLAGYRVMNYFARNLDNVLIGKLVGAQALGLYSRAYGLLMLPIRQVNAPLSNVAVPTLSRLVDSPERYRRVYRQAIEKIGSVSMPAVAFLIVTADWVILIALGPTWREAAMLFAFLGLSGIAQPITNTTGWLFITQNRTREMFRWGIIGGALSILSFVVGLPWGAVGVAASYGVSGLLVRTPLLLWYVSRVGPVTHGDLYRAMRTPAISAFCVAIASLSVRSTGIEHPVGGIIACSIAAISVWFLVYCAHADGRRVLSDWRGLIRFNVK